MLLLVYGLTCLVEEFIINNPLLEEGLLNEFF